MTNAPEPAFGSPRRSEQPVWWWRLLDSEGREVGTDQPRSEFPTRSDAESWLGEAYPDLADDGWRPSPSSRETDVYGPDVAGRGLSRARTASRQRGAPPSLTCGLGWRRKRICIARSTV